MQAVIKCHIMSAGVQNRDKMLYSVMSHLDIHCFIILTLCMLGNFSCFCCDLLTFFKSSFKNTIRVSNCLDPDQSVLIQTVCKGYQQMTQVASSKDRVKILKNSN